MKTQNFIIGILLYSFSFAFAQYTNVAIDTNSSDQTEVTIAISPLNSDYLKASWMDYRLGGLWEPGYAFSVDGGSANSWNEDILPDSGSYNKGADPSSAFDNFGNAFYCYLALATISGERAIIVSRTTTFTPPFSWKHTKVNDSNAIYTDKPFMVVDNTSGNFEGRIYVSWMNSSQGVFRIMFAHSADSGKTFSSDIVLDSIAAANKAGAYFTPPPDIPSGNPSPGVVNGSMPAVGPNGEVYVVWMDVENVTTHNGGILRIRKSTDGGETFSTEALVDSFTWDRGQWGNIDHSNLPSLAVDPSNGYVYVAYKDRFPDPDSLPRIKFVRSTDAGNSWSQTKTIGNLGGKGEVFPSVACDAYGKVAVTFLHKDADDSVDCYLVESYDHGANFRSPVRVSNESSDPENTPSQNHHYQGMVLDDEGNDYVVWTDHRNGNADPYFAKVNTPPEPPQNIAPSVVGERKHPRIDWAGNPETDIKEYQVWKKIDQGSWNLLATTTQTFYIDSGELGATLAEDCADCIPLYYKIKAVDLADNTSDFSSEVSFNVSKGQQKPGDLDLAATEASQTLPDQYILFQNYPNPFNPVTTIQFGVPEKSNVQLIVYNIAGEHIATLVSGEYPVGYHRVIFDASHLASGLYLYRMKAEEFVQTCKMMVLK